MTHCVGFTGPAFLACSCFVHVDLRGVGGRREVHGLDSMLTLPGPRLRDKCRPTAAQLTRFGAVGVGELSSAGLELAGVLAETCTCSL